MSITTRFGDTHGTSGTSGSTRSPRTPNAGTHTSKSNISRKGLRQLLESQGYFCALTGELLQPATASLDHKLPLGRGGSNSIDNLQVIHQQVNAAKGTMTNEEFVAMCRAVASWTDR